MTMSSSDTKDVSKLKQKSLMSFFGKQPAANTTAPAAKESTTQTKARANTDKLAKDSASSSKPATKEPRTPLSKTTSQSSAITSAMYTRSSDGGFSIHETPPTSDPIDVDMLSDDDEGLGRKVAKAPVCSSAFMQQVPLMTRVTAGDTQPETKGGGSGLG